MTIKLRTGKVHECRVSKFGRKETEWEGPIIYTVQWKENKFVGKELYLLDKNKTMKNQVLDC